MSHTLHPTPVESVTDCLISSFLYAVNHPMGPSFRGRASNKRSSNGPSIEPIKTRKSSTSFLASTIDLPLHPLLTPSPFHHPPINSQKLVVLEPWLASPGSDLVAFPSDFLPFKWPFACTRGRHPALARIWLPTSPHLSSSSYTAGGPRVLMATSDGLNPSSSVTWILM